MQAAPLGAYQIKLILILVTSPKCDWSQSTSQDKLWSYLSTFNAAFIYIYLQPWSYMIQCAFYRNLFMFSVSRERRMTVLLWHLTGIVSHKCIIFMTSVRSAFNHGSSAVYRSLRQCWQLTHQWLMVMMTTFPCNFLPSTSPWKCCVTSH